MALNAKQTKYPNMNKNSGELTAGKQSKNNKRNGHHNGDSVKMATHGDQKSTTALEKCISSGDIEQLKQLIQTEDTAIDSSLFILACKHNQVQVVACLLSIVTEGTVLPHDQDEAGHNAFYYAVRSGNVQLLETLIDKWPGEYFSARLGELDDLVSRAYEELKLKNVALSEKMEVFVKQKLINLRFFCSGSAQEKNAKGSLRNIKDRVELVVQNIALLKTDYCNSKVDDKFLFVAKFIAQNIHILKRKLKSTYDRLPWEEIEFCLVSFIASQTKEQEINLFFNATLNKNKILNYLDCFAKKLIKEVDILKEADFKKLAELPKLKRDSAIFKITESNPEFLELYKDYQQIMDIYSLEKISDYIKLALMTEAKQREGQIIITRVLQVIGEYLKNTLESPKLSSATSELLLLSLPKNTRQVLIDLRNAFSHAYSLATRTGIEENSDEKFFIGVQNDTKIIADVINNILFNRKFKVITTLLKEIVNSDDLVEIKRIAEILGSAHFGEIFKNPEIFNDQYNRIIKVLRELDSVIVDKSIDESVLFKELDRLMDFRNLKNFKIDYLMAFASLKSFDGCLNDNMSDSNFLRTLKFFAGNALTHFPEFEVKADKLKKVAELAAKIWHFRNVSKVDDDDREKISKLICEIFMIVQSETGDLKWINKLRDKLNENGSFLSTFKRKVAAIFSKEKCNKQLGQKLEELKDILSRFKFGNESNNELTSYKENKKQQAVVDMLVLDIMSILGISEKNLENNLLFLDEDTPLLIGKCLRNHLAHDNVLLEVLNSDAPLSVVLNAKKLVSENLVHSKKTVGKPVRDNPAKVKDKYEQSLDIIRVQEGLFTALEAGNLEEVMGLLSKGADLNGRTVDATTAMHFAARGSSIKVIKFLLDQKVDVNVYDSNGQSPLHIAAAYGRREIVEWFAKESGLCVNEADKQNKTPLHIAAENGHTKAVEILLKYKANTNLKDNTGFSALHSAIRSNYIKVVKILIKLEINFDMNEAMGGQTPLFIAAERGYFDLVNYLLNNGAKVGIRNDFGATPLHAAALFGHAKVVDALIQAGSDVNSRNFEGRSPLLLAAEAGFEEVSIILIKHGAKVNLADNTNKKSPLFFAAGNGKEGIVKTLLKHKADANIVSEFGVTPLHNAVINGHLNIVLILLEHGANLHMKDMKRATALHYAANHGHKKIANILIKRGAKVNEPGLGNLGPLHMACHNGHRDVAELLIKNNAVVDAQCQMDGTPLHMAAKSGHTDIIELLLKSKATVNEWSPEGVSALHLAAYCGHMEAVDLLIKHNADVNSGYKNGNCPINNAVIAGHKDIVKILLQNNAKVSPTQLLITAITAGHVEIVSMLISHGANVNVKSEKLTALGIAVKHNHKDIVEILLKNDANVNGINGEPLAMAVTAGQRDIVEILLRKKPMLHFKTVDCSMLHLAALRGHKEITKALLLAGAKVDDKNSNGLTPLCIAAIQGLDEIAALLLSHRANANSLSDDGSPMHVAAEYGHGHVVEVLLKYGGKVHLKDNNGRTPLELAVGRNHVEVVKILLRHKKGDINAKGNGDFTLLHKASENGNLEVVKLLVEEGCNLTVKNISGSKPIHLAAREGFIETVKFFLSKGLKVEEPGCINQTVLHYSTMKGHVELVNYLISEGANINAKDNDGRTPLHTAAYLGEKKVVKTLLEHGAHFNIVDKNLKTPLQVAANQSVAKLLKSIEKLFESVKRNSPLDVETAIQEGAVVNAKKTNKSSALHYAAWKGHEGVAKILLQHTADPNAVGNMGFTPLHFATKFSHFKLVKTLLAHGAVYNSCSDSGKTPLDLTEDKEIRDLFLLVTEAFKMIAQNNARVVKDLNNIKDIETVKAVLNARNRENQTLIVTAVLTNFTCVEQLKQVWQSDSTEQLNKAVALLNAGDYKKALNIFKRLHEKRKKILGPDNPGTLDIETQIAKVLLQQGSYTEALKRFEDIYEKQKTNLGLNTEDTLNTRSMVALVLHYQGKNDEALKMFHEVYDKQREVMGAEHSDTLDTQCYMALVLDKLKKYDEALCMNQDVYSKYKKKLGPNHPAAIRAYNNVAMVLSHLKKYDEALKIYQEVLKQKKNILGTNHSDTVRTLHNIAAVLCNQNKYNEALITFNEALIIQNKTLGVNHPDTLNTQISIAHAHFAQCNFIKAYKIYNEILNNIRDVFGPLHPTVMDVLQKIDVIKGTIKLVGTHESDVLRDSCNDINTAASKGDFKTVERLISEGTDVNIKDAEGRTPLHFAVSGQHVDIVKLLLNNGACVTHATNKGNTPLHTATAKSNVDIMKILLHHVSPDKLQDFVNAKTTASGSTCLHIAVKNNHVDGIFCLYFNGAILNVRNNDGKRPIDLANNQTTVKSLLSCEEHRKISFELNND